MGYPTMGNSVLAHRRGFKMDHGPRGCPPRSAVLHMICLYLRQESRKRGAQCKPINRLDSGSSQNNANISAQCYTVSINYTQWATISHSSCSWDYPYSVRSFQLLHSHPLLG